MGKFRFALIIFARIVHDFYLDLSCNTVTLSEEEYKKADALIESVETQYLPAEVSSNQHEKVVAHFVLKSIVRKYGMSTLMLLRNTDKLSWLFQQGLPKTMVSFILIFFFLHCILFIGK